MRKESSDLTAKMTQLQRDNVGLFERIKFLQHYQRDNEAIQLQQKNPTSSLQQVVIVSAALLLTFISPIV